jgi:hypothetical protein
MSIFDNKLKIESLLMYAEAKDNNKYKTQEFDERKVL